MADNEKITDATKEAEQKDAQAQHGAPQVPTAAEEAAAKKQADPEVAEAYEDYLDKAKDAKGEGRLP
jgi:hypothetical protein